MQKNKIAVAITQGDNLPTKHPKLPKRVSNISGIWAEYLDNDTGRTYYVNTKTNETTWEKPEHKSRRSQTSRY